jgi:cell division protein FtsI (penicillin-binding protein 3)
VGLFLEPHRDRRVVLLTRAFLLWALILAGKLVHLHVWRHAELAAAARQQHNGTETIPAPRGKILDRTGQTLALSVPVESAFADPRDIDDIDSAAEQLGLLLGIDAGRLHERLAWGVENRKAFVWIKRKLTDEETARLKALGKDWIRFQRETKRIYPKGSIAAHVVGTVDFDETGNSGLELSLERELRGKPGVVTFLRDSRKRGVEFHVLVEPQAGTDVRLSIDERIQYVANRELERAAREYDCPTGSLVVVNPHNGEILAMSSYPPFDPNEPVRESGDLAARTNQAISVPFEPGSVFKVVTLATALETTELTPESPIDCGPGYLVLHGRTIRDIHAYGTLPLQKVLAKSSNIGTIRAALRVGERQLYESIRRFGFGERTGVPLPAESPGVVHPLGRWHATSIGSVAMGHEVSATALQLALAVSAIANGGVLMKPRLILGRQTADGVWREEPPVEVRRVLKPETAVLMRRMMESVVLEGTGRQARLAGFTAGGKTGSAQIADPVTRRYTHRYNASFVGFAPVQNPVIVVAVTLNGAPRYGGVVAAPVFQRVAHEALRILGAVPDIPLEEIAPWASTREEEEELADVADAGTEAAGTEEVAGGGGAAAEEAPGGPDYLIGPRVPDFRGKPLRAVLAESTRSGIPVELEGNGIARRQEPPPGTVLAAGKKVRIVLAP